MKRIPIPAWNSDPFLVVIVSIGIAVLSLKCSITYPIEFIGGTDEAAYVGVAVNLANGKGFTNDHMQYSFFQSGLKYPEVTHPEAHYPPLYSILIVPFFLILGKTAFAAKLPSILIGSIFLPVFLYLLTERLSRSRLTGFAAGLSAMFFPVVFSSSITAGGDLLFAFMILASCYLIIKAHDSPKYFYPAGVFIGLAYYAKGTGLWIIPAYFIFCVMLGGFKILRSRKVWICFAIVFLVMLPWFVRNTIHFGNPIFSTQQYAAGYIGYTDWEEGSYSLHWGKEMPSLFDKLGDAGFKTVGENTWKYFRRYIWWSFMNMKGFSLKDLEAKNFLAYYAGIPAALGLLLFFLSCLYSLLRRPATEQEHEKRGIGRFLKPWHNRDLHILWLVSAFLITFLAVCWSPISRLVFPVVVIIMAIGWTTYHVAAKQFFAKTKRPQIMTSCLIAALMMLVLCLSVAEVYGDHKRGWPYGETGEARMEAGKWLKENAPDSVVMYREPGGVSFYSEGKALQIPLDELDRTIMVMKFYNVTHIIPVAIPGPLEEPIPRWVLRPATKPLVEGKMPGLKLVYDKGLKIYEIQYDLLPAVEIDFEGFRRKSGNAMQ